MKALIGMFGISLLTINTFRGTSIGIALIFYVLKDMNGTQQKQIEYMLKA